MEIRSEKGKVKLLHEGYLFIFDKYICGGEQKAWKCESARNRCRGRIWTDPNNNVLDMPKNRNIIHSHDANPADVIKKERMTALKRRAQVTMEPPALLRANILENVPSPALDLFPTTNATKKVIKRSRREMQAPPPNSQTVAESASLINELVELGLKIEAVESALHTLALAPGNDFNHSMAALQQDLARLNKSQAEVTAQLDAIADSLAGPADPIRSQERGR